MPVGAVLYSVCLNFISSALVRLERNEAIRGRSFHSNLFSGVRVNSRPIRRMDIVQRGGTYAISMRHNSPRSCISVSYCTTVVTHIRGLLVVVSSDIVP